MRSYDLIVIGAGSGNMLLGPELAQLRAAIIECDRFGGTCLNRGCIPSKMLVVTADAARSVLEAGRLGVHASLERVDWPKIRARIFGRLDPLHERAVEYRRRGGVDVYPAPARFVAPRVLEVAGEQLTAEQIVVAAGARPTDDAYRTSVPGVWAFGDAANHFQLKHMANAEERVVLHNLTHPGNPRRLPRHLVPHAVFADPQIASVGMTEQQARRLGIDYTTAVREYADTAYGWALEDTTSFVKLIADPHACTLLGAHIIGPQASLLLQPLLQAMMLGQTVDQLARDVLYVHPALPEVLEQALLELANRQFPS